MSDKIKMHRVNKATLRKQAYHKRIVDAAITLFTEQGVDETPITDVIRKAGVAHKTFFNHFSNKHQLMMHIAEDYFKGLEAIIQQETAGHDNAAIVLEASFNNIAETINGLDQRTGRMLGHLVLQAHVASSYNKFHIIAELNKIVVGLLTDARRQNCLNEEFGIETYAELVTSIFVGIINNWANDKDYDLVGHMRQASEFIVKTVFDKQACTSSSNMVNPSNRVTA